MQRRNFFKALLVLPAIVTKQDVQDSKSIPNVERIPVTCLRETFALRVDGKWYTPLLVPAHE